MNTHRFPRIAFTGYSRTGKDVATNVLIARGYRRVAFGDIIKNQLDPLIRHHLGFSAFTEIDKEKQIIRPVLESWGDANYDTILDELMSSLPELAANARVCRLKEAKRWREGDGILVEIKRPGTRPATEWEAKAMETLRSSGLITHEIVESDKKALEKRVEELAFT